MLKPVPVPGHLFVAATPADARIRILNIQPKYYRGIQLEPGRYHIEVSKNGYKTDWQWVKVGSEEDLKIDVQLKKDRSDGVLKREGRFVAYRNGTVKDSGTGLMWAAKDSSNAVSWHGAERYCENYTGGGYTDWRMPTQDELSELYKAGIREVDSKGNHIIDIWAYVWGSNIRKITAVSVFFRTGSQFWRAQSYSYTDRALPVRNEN